jgi:hypothetical protein
VNPAEWLRSITHRADDDELAVEAADALSAFARQPGLVVACRRLLAHHPGHGVLWWVCSSVLAAPDPEAAAAEVVRRLDADRTPDRLSAALPLLEPDEVVVTCGWNRTIDRALAERPDLAAVVLRLPGDSVAESLRRRSGTERVRVVDPWECGVLEVGQVLVPVAAMTPGRALVRAGTSAALDELGAQTPRWLVAGVGRILPPLVVEAIERAVAATGDAGGASLEPIALEGFERVVGPQGAQRPDDATNRFDCPIAHELLRPLDRPGR